MHFVLNALIKQAESNTLKASAILQLYNGKKTEVAVLTHSQYSIHALDWIFERPVSKSSDFVKSAGIPAPTARRILIVLRDNGLLTTIEEASGQKSGVYAFTELLNVAEGRDVF